MKNGQEKSDNHNGIYSKKNLIIIMVFILLSLLWCFVPVLIARCGAAEMNQGSITIPRQQWIELKIQLERQQVTLLTLQEEITMLKKPSRDLMQNLNEARQQLKTAQNELTASNSEQLVEECIDGNRQALDIMQRIEAANTAGKEKSQP